MMQAVTFILMIGILAAPARGDDQQQYVILQTQQPIAERIFAEDLPGGWKFIGFEIGGSEIKMTYQRGDPPDEVILAVGHPSNVESSKLRTERFAVTVVESSVQADVERALLAGLETRIRSREDGWTWKSIACDPTESSVPRASPPQDVGKSVTRVGGWLTRMLVRAWDVHTQVLGSVTFGHVSLGVHARDRLLRTTLDQVHAAEAALLRHDVEAVRSLVKEIDRVWEDIDRRHRPSISLGAGFALLEAKMTDEALRWFERTDADINALLAEAPPESLAAYVLHVESVRVRIGLGALEDPKAAVVELLSRAPSAEAACSLFDIARSLERAGRRGESLALLRQLHAAHRDCLHGYRIIARLSTRTGEGEALIELLKEGVERFPDDVGIVSAVANYYKFVGKKDEALRVLEGLVARGHTNAGLLGEIMGMYARNKDTTKQYQERFLKDAEERPDDPVAAFFAGALLHYKKDYERSTELLLKAAPELPHVPRIWLYIAMNHHRGDGDHALAVKYIDRAVLADTTDPDVFYCRGVIHMDDDTDAAISDLEDYLAMTRDTWDVPAAKTDKVTSIVEKLKACKDAEVPSECVGIDPP